MPALGETIARLRDTARAMSPADSSADFQRTDSFGENPGNLRMLTYAPAGLPKGRPLVVVLHGCAQTAEGYAAAAGWVALAGRLGFAVLAPEQLSANNPNRCFNWFLDQDIERGQGEAASIAAMVARAASNFGSDPDQVFVTGLSAGGAMTAVMLATYPELFAAGAVVAGLPYGAAHNVQEAMLAMHRNDAREPAELARLVQRGAPPTSRTPRLTVWHGDADWTVNVSNGVSLARQWAALQPSPASEYTTEHPALRRTVWRKPGSDAPVVELNIVHGLGHGTPISTDPDGVGFVAPFVLSAGVSSTLEIARFWGLAPQSGEAAPESHAGSKPRPGPDRQTTPSARLGARVMATIAPHVPANVSDVIAGALRKAGLLQ